MITIQLTLQSREDGVRGTVTQSGTLYSIQITERDMGDFSLDVDNKASGSHQSDVRRAGILRDAVIDALELMGELAHNPFPGFEES
jgi:hypothetical protein